MIFTVPLLVMIYIKQKSDTNIQQTPPIAITNSKTLNLRGIIRDLKLSEDSNIIYAVADSRGIYILDIQNPLEAKIISQFKYFKNSYDKSRSIELAKKRNILFVRDAQAGIYSLDLENIAEPKLLTTYQSQEQIYTFRISNNENYLYLIDEKSLKVLDITNFDTIKTIAAWEIKKKYSDIIEVKENLLYLLSPSGIDIFDMSFHKTPQQVEEYIASGDVEKITLSSDATRAFLSNGQSGVEILDIANKMHPKALGIYRTSITAKDTLISKDGAILYISDLENTFETVDITNPDDAKQLQHIHINATNKAKILDFDLSVNENILYVANGIAGFKIVRLR